MLAPAAATASPVSPGPGRPSKFTPEIVGKLLEALAEGNKHATACQLAGLSYPLFRQWIVAGEAGEPGFIEFLEQVKMAEGQAEQNLLRTIRVAGDTDWKAAGWIMARRFGWVDESRLTVDHTGTVTNAIEITVLTSNDLSGIAGLLGTGTPAQLIEGHVVDPDEETTPGST